MEMGTRVRLHRRPPLCFFVMVVFGRQAAEVHSAFGGAGVAEHLPACFDAPEVHFALARCDRQLKVSEERGEVED